MGSEGKARFAVAGLMQILAPHPSYHAELVNHLAAIGKPAGQEATEALARLAVFSADEKAQPDGRDRLAKASRWPSNRPTAQGTSLSRRAWRHGAEAIVQLKRTDLLGELIKLLEEPDPRAPAVRTIKGQPVTVVRELVRVQHARNCLLCHPPGNTPDVLKPAVDKWSEIEKGVWSTKTHYPRFDHQIVLGAVPIPGHSVPERSGYRVFLTDRVVRADVTYLRPDFSGLHKMADLGHWPEMQRFDYLVRSRILTDSEAQAYREAFAGQRETSPYCQLALDALRRLTGKDAGGIADQSRKALE